MDLLQGKTKKLDFSNSIFVKRWGVISLNIIRLKKFALEAEVNWKEIEDYIIAKILENVEHTMAYNSNKEFSKSFVEWYIYLPEEYFDSDDFSIEANNIVVNPFNKKWKESQSTKHKSKPLKRTIKK